MHTRKSETRPVAAGSALLIALIFVALFACMAVALAVVSESNLAICRNRRDIQQAQNLTETGLYMVQRELGGLEVSGADAAAVHGCLANYFQVAWASIKTTSSGGVTADAEGVTFPPILVPGPGGQFGTITLTMQADGGVEEGTTITVASTGRFNDATRTAYYDFRVDSGYRLLNDFGVVSRSPITMGGGALIDGANDDAEASLFSSSSSQTHAIEMAGQTQITGDAAVSAEGCEVYKGPNATIGGDIGNGVPDYSWPDVDTAHFEQYVETVYSGESTETDGTYTNIRIPPNTNPTFNGNTQLYGVVYIESPNVVTFEGNATICGVVVCEEPTIENLSRNQVNFTGGLVASGVEYLPDEPRFDGLRNETGTFLLAPGYAANFAGNFTTINGTVVASQFGFAGTASGIIRGNLMNLSDTALTLEGDAHLTIDKSEATGHPAGILPRYALICISGSYRE